MKSEAFEVDFTNRECDVLIGTLSLWKCLLKYTI